MSPSVMADTKHYARRAPGARIEISLNRVSQLFNSLDPAPFHERDLDRNAEDYIIGSAGEIPRRPHHAAHRAGVPIQLRAGAGAGVFIRQSNSLRSRRRKHADHRLGRHVAAVGDFPLRMAADPPPLPDFGEAFRNAGHRSAERTAGSGRPALTCIKASRAAHR